MTLPLAVNSSERVALFGGIHRRRNVLRRAETCGGVLTGIAKTAGRPASLPVSSVTDETGHQACIIARSTYGACRAAMVARIISPAAPRRSFQRPVVLVSTAQDRRTHRRPTTPNPDPTPPAVLPIIRGLLGRGAFRRQQKSSTEARRFGPCWIRREAWSDRYSTPHLLQCLYGLDLLWCALPADHGFAVVCAAMAIGNYVNVL